MLSLGPIAFAQPWVLLGLLALPVIWWLVRAIPPPPRLQSFPALRLLLDLPKRERTTSRTPWWLLLIRMLAAAAVIIGLAAPILNPVARLVGSGPLLIVVDDGWTAAAQWTLRRQTLEALISGAERAGRPVAVIGTAAPLDGGPHAATKLRPAGEARALVEAWQPKPWLPDHDATRSAVEEIDLPRPAEAVWLSDGFDHGDVRALAETLQRLGALQILREGSARLARFLPAPRNEPNGLVAVVRRPPIAEEEDLWIRAIAENGNVVGREKAHFASGAGEASAVFALPGEIRNRISRLEIDGHATAGATVLVDERWRRRPVGLVSGGPADTAQPLLADTYYLNRALAPFAEVREGPLATLLERPLSILALADVGQIVGDERQILERWLQNGGVLVRFAGPRLAESADDLVPTKLRGGGRTLEGALQWAQPAALAPFPPESPFAGLSIPDEVTVRRQVLAEPMPDLGRKTWARLADGTPLVTAEPRGKGWLVLFHTTANTTWSNLPISGLFVEMLQRLVALGQGVAGQDAAGLLAPIASLDGFGRVVPPLAAAVPATAETLATKPPSPRQPPGFYGKEGYRLAYNATSGLASLKPLGDMPSGVVSRAYAGDREVELKRWLILAALMLIFVDLLASFALRGLIRLPLAAASLLLLLAPLWPGPARADDAFVKAATQNTRLAYVRTGLADVDRMSHAGLVGLSDVLARRTSVESDQPLGVDVESDDLMFFPLLYWPIVPEQRDLSPRALAKIDAFMKTGGTILFDTRDQAQVVPMGQGGGPGAQRLRRLLNRLDIPPLRPVPPDHVLTKAFYLMQEFPGRHAGGALWVERYAEGVNDGVSGLIVGANDWAAAWAIDAKGNHLAAVVPGGERQREMAYRFGINLVMYVLTGNYKADQVHVPAILERLGQ